MDAPSNINPARNYDTTTTSCECPSRTTTRPWEPCKHMVRLMERNAEADRLARTYEGARWQRACAATRKGRARADRREAAREREAA